MKFIAQRTLEEVLQDFMGCPNPFDEDGSVTEHGWKAYGRLTEMLYDIGNLTETDVTDMVETLDNIIDNKF